MLAFLSARQSLLEKESFLRAKNLVLLVLMVFLSSACGQYGDLYAPPEEDIPEEDIVEQQAEPSPAEQVEVQEQLTPTKEDQPE